jgi:hypothetical protein
MTEDAAVSPDERALREHLRGARFQSGADAGRWRCVSLTWPNALIAVTAAHRESAPAEFVLKFDLSGYPAAAPTAGLWDLATETYLAASARPKGERAAIVFRGDWNGGSALYAAWDRAALAGHPDWSQRFPQYAWNASRDLTFYLSNVHDVLNDDGYLGV